MNKPTTYHYYSVRSTVNGTLITKYFNTKLARRIEQLRQLEEHHTYHNVTTTIVVSVVPLFTEDTVPMPY
jgi:hypothetical protein